MPFPAIAAVLGQIARQVATSVAAGAVEATAARAAAGAATTAAEAAARLAQWQQATGNLPTGRPITANTAAAHAGPPTAVPPAAPPGAPPRPPPTNTSSPAPGSGPNKPPVVVPGQTASQKAAAGIANQLFEMGKQTISQGIGTMTGDAISSMFRGSAGQGQPGKENKALTYFGIGSQTQQWIGDARMAGGSVAKMADPLGVAGGAAKLGGMAFRAIPGVKQLEGLAKAAAEMPARLEAWGDELMASRAHLAQFNGAIASAVGHSQLRDMQRNIKAGAATGGTTKSLAEALDKFKDNMQPIKNAGANIANTIATGVLQIANGMVAALETIPLMKDAAEALKKAFPEVKSDPTMMQFINRLAAPPKPGVPPKV